MGAGGSAAVKAWAGEAGGCGCAGATRPALTASVRGVTDALQVGTKKRLSGRTKKLTRRAMKLLSLLRYGGRAR
jgi:hypothetical protein